VLEGGRRGGGDDSGGGREGCSGRHGHSEEGIVILAEHEADLKSVLVPQYQLVYYVFPQVEEHDPLQAGSMPPSARTHSLYQKIRRVQWKLLWDDSGPDSTRPMGDSKSSACAQISSRSCLFSRKRPFLSWAGECLMHPLH
jgi:hypothetical protein